MKDELKVVGKQEFMGVEIPVIEGGFGDDKRIVTAKTVSEIHKSRLADVNATIKRMVDKKRLKEGVDYIDCLSETVSLRSFAESMGLIGSNRTQNVFILSERGYSKLIKAMDDDASWEVMDQFIDNYFAMRKELREVLSEEEKYALALLRAESKEEMILITRDYQLNVVKPLRESVDRYERFLCSKTQLLTKSQLATKLDTSTGTIASLFKKLGIYTPKNCQLSEKFLEKFPNIKMFDEKIETYIDKKTGEEKSNSTWQYTFLGAKNLIDYLIDLGYVTFTENDGFKLKKKVA